MLVLFLANFRIHKYVAPAPRRDSGGKFSGRHCRSSTDSPPSATVARPFVNGSSAGAGSMAAFADVVKRGGVYVHVMNPKTDHAKLRDIIEVLGPTCSLSEEKNQLYFFCGPER